MIVRYWGNSVHTENRLSSRRITAAEKREASLSQQGSPGVLSARQTLRLGPPRRVRQIVTRAFPMTDGRNRYGDVHAVVRSLHFPVDTAGHGPFVLGRHRPRRRRRSRGRSDQSEEGRREDRREDWPRLRMCQAESLAQKSWSSSDPRIVRAESRPQRRPRIPMPRTRRAGVSTCPGDRSPATLLRGVFTFLRPE